MDWVFVNRFLKKIDFYRHFPLPAGQNSDGYPRCSVLSIKPQKFCIFSNEITDEFRQVFFNFIVWKTCGKKKSVL